MDQNLIQAAMSDLTRTSITPTQAPSSLRNGKPVSPQKVRERWFNDFNDLGEPVLIEARDAAVRFCVAMASADVPAYWLVLLGPSGTGKTMLARRCNLYFQGRLDMRLDEAYPREIRYRRGGVKNWGTVIGDMLMGDFSGIRDMREDWFLCLDDIGAESSRVSELSVSKLYEILNARERRFTIITCNFGLADIAARLDTRIASRLMRHGAVVVDVNTTDFALR